MDLNLDVFLTCYVCERSRGKETRTKETKDMYLEKHSINSAFESDANISSTEGLAPDDKRVREKAPKR